MDFYCVSVYCLQNMQVEGYTCQCIYFSKNFIVSFKLSACTIIIAILQGNSVH